MNDLNLNPFLFPNNSPYVQNLGLTSGYQFNYENERGAVINTLLRDGAITTTKIGTAQITNALLGTAVIGTAQIGTLTFNEISGGTATLGGTTNGNGVLSVKNASGSEVVRADNTGLTVTNGSVTIQDSSGSSVLDSSGLVSTTNFIFGGTANFLNTRTTGSTDFVDVANTSFDIVLSRSARVLFLCYGDFSNYTGNGEQITEHVALSVGGTLFPDATNGFGAVYFNGDTSDAGVTTVLSSWSGQAVVAIGSGTTSVKLKWRKGSNDTAALNARVINTSLYYLLLGK